MSIDQGYRSFNDPNDDQEPGCRINLGKADQE